MRGVVITKTDPVITLGVKLDDHLGSSSPAVFPKVRFVRIAKSTAELIDDRRDTPQFLADAGLAPEEVLDAPGNDPGERDLEWLDTVRSRHRERVARAASTPAPSGGADGTVRTTAILEALCQVADPDCIGIAGGGDPLSYARIGLQTRTCPDAGIFGCLGLGVSVAVAAALARPGRQVVSVTGDGDFGSPRWKSTRRSGTAPEPSSSSRTMWPGDVAERRLRTGAMS